MADVGSAERERAEAVAAAAARRAADLGVPLPGTLRLWSLVGTAPRAARADPGPGETELAMVLEAVTPAHERRANGLHVTPAWLADHLVGLALADVALAGEDLTVCDPACGGGAFLLAAARALHQRGVARRHIVRHLLWGADIDPVGLATAEAALTLWAGEPPPADHLAVGDALMLGASVWPDPPSTGFAAVVGNPPFLSQLGRTTVRSREDVLHLRRRFGAAVQAYTDTAWLFLLLGVELARPGGRIALVQPLSLVGARDAAAVRATLDRHTELRELWVEQRPSFAASVQVCAPVLQLTGGGSGRGDWAGRLADALGIPAVTGPTHPCVGDRALVRAGFRDEYYGLVPLVREADDRGGGRPLVTVGILDWGRSRWGQRPTQFAKRRWTAPVVDLDRADPGDDSAVARAGVRWIERVSVPKVVVATQTRVVEPAVDEVGDWVPSVPALVVLPRCNDDLWRLGAAIAAPSSTAWLLRRAPGTALSRGALKIAARDLADLPLPVDDVAWSQAAAAFRNYSRTPGPEAFEAFVAAAAAAYTADDAVVAWWRERLSLRFASSGTAG
jgi:N-6 DNA Methylase